MRASTARLAASLNAGATMVSSNRPGRAVRGRSAAGGVSGSRLPDLMVSGTRAHVPHVSGKCAPFHSNVCSRAMARVDQTISRRRRNHRRCPRPSLPNANLDACAARPIARRPGPCCGLSPTIHWQASTRRTSPPRPGLASLSVAEVGEAGDRAGRKAWKRARRAVGDGAPPGSTPDRSPPQRGTGSANADQRCVFYAPSD